MESLHVMLIFFTTYCWHRHLGTRVNIFYSVCLENIDRGYKALRFSNFVITENPELGSHLHFDSQIADRCTIFIPRRESALQLLRGPIVFNLGFIGVVKGVWGFKNTSDDRPF